MSIRVAFVHEWLTTPAGSEKVLEAALEVFPNAPLYVLVYDASKYSNSSISRRTIRTSFLQHLPKAVENYRSYLPLMPIAVEQFDLREYEVVISSSHAVAKGVLTSADQLHIAYLHTPVRYAWDLYHQYIEESGAGRGPTGVMARAVLHYLRLWDAASANRVDKYLANSRYVARRIRKTYGRKAEVIYPPVEVQRFRHQRPREDFFLIVSRIVPYKRVETIVAAFNALQLPLIVIGGGPGLRKIRQLAGENVTVLGEQPDSVVADYLERCRAFVFAADEDFGITPVEAQAAGAPVLAWAKGGVLETVINGETGSLFQGCEVSSVVAAVRAFDPSRFSPSASRANAERFDRKVFCTRFEDYVHDAWLRFRRISRP